MSLPDCQESCANITIPYPFGITRKCAMNEWFEVICNKTGTHQRAFIKSINVELIQFQSQDTWDFSTKNSFEIKGPVMSSNCGTRGNVSSLNLSNSPFTITGDNTFIAIGCNTRATMSQIYPEIVGCESTCSGKNSTVLNYAMDGCNGTNCCETTIPSAHQVFDVKLERTNSSVSERDECQLAFLASQSWLSSESDLRSSVQNMDYVPLVLQWRMFFPISDSYSTGVMCDSVVTTGLRHSNYSDCSCRSGFEGNPYLPNGDGCQDIDECQRNPYTCYSGAKCVNLIGNYDCKEDRSWIVILAVCLGVGVFLALIAIWRLYIYMKKRKQIKLKKKFFKRNGGLILQQQLSSHEQGTIDTMKVFTAKELETATDNFSDNRILGQGGQGTVYKGMLVDGKIVAVKKSKLIDEEKLDEFINEVVILSQINHRNVVKLLGCCLETNVPVLVYEYISNGNLFKYLHAQKDEAPMSWEMRLRIASEVAGALAEHSRSLATHFLLTMEENLLCEIIDPHIKQECGEESLAFAELAKSCLYLNGKLRPSMKEVSRELDRIIGIGFSRKDSIVRKNRDDINQFVEADMIMISNSCEYTSSTMTTSSSFPSSSVFSLDLYNYTVPDSEGPLTTTIWEGVRKDADKGFNV
ncbi:hypothetical protein ACFE04_031928 [Oxalis oulophora]